MTLPWKLVLFAKSFRSTLPTTAKTATRCLLTASLPTSSPTASASASLPRQQLYSTAISSGNIAEDTIIENKEEEEEEEEEGDIFIMSFPDEMLEHDTYNGISLRLDHIHTIDNVDDGNNNNNKIDLDEVLEPNSFRERLQSSLEQWRQEGRKGIWIFVPNARAGLVPIASSMGFQFHMVNQQGVLILSQWLPTDVPSRLPRGPMYQCGVGCVVLKPDDPTKMLVVQELTGPAAAMKLWKVPTGLVDPAEDIHEAAERELLEETGLQATCDGILVFRQSHVSRAGHRAASDLFFMCRMRLTDPNRVDLIKQPEEIADIQWMDIQEFCQQEHWRTSPLYTELNEVCLRANERGVFGPAKLQVGFRNAPDLTNTLYKSSL